VVRAASTRGVEADFSREVAQHRRRDEQPAFAHEPVDSRDALQLHAAGDELTSRTVEAPASFFTPGGRTSDG
jgi:hypothetical protein